MCAETLVSAWAGLSCLWRITQCALKPLFLPELYCRVCDMSLHGRWNPFGSKIWTVVFVTCHFMCAETLVFPWVGLSCSWRVTQCTLPFSAHLHTLTTQMNVLKRSLLTFASRCMCFGNFLRHTFCTICKWITHSRRRQERGRGRKRERGERYGECVRDGGTKWGIEEGRGRGREKG